MEPRRVWGVGWLAIAGERAQRRKLLAIVLALFLSGCSVLDEINRLGGGEVAEEAGDENCENDSQSEACKKKAANGWANIRSLSVDDMKADIVNCRIKNSTQFTTRESCLARGGAPLG